MHRSLFFAAMTSMACVVASVVACRDEAAKPPSVVVAPEGNARRALPSRLPESGWDSAAGSAIIVAASGASDSVSILRPDFVEGRYSDTSTFDLRSISDTKLDLFGRSGRFGSATLQSGVSKRRGVGCTAWPAGHIVRGREVPGWRVALETGRAESMSIDSLAGMSAPDSARLVSALVQAATLSTGRSDSVFVGVPFLARRVYRLQLQGTDVVAASLQRSIPSEANPREEQLFVIAERPTTSDSAYHIAFLRHSAGGEVPAQVTDVLTAVVLRANHRPALIVSNEYEDGGSIGLIERVSPGRWRETWKSGYTGC
ncbi:MAG: hypothetical protein ACR2GG_07420 [Gemmatimonadaceae bacterium]